MPFLWDEDRIRWFLTASDYTGYHRALAGHLRPWLRPEDTLADLACGLGLLALELAPDVHRVEAVDRDVRVIAQLSARAAARGIENLHAKAAPFEAAGCCDVALISFFGFPAVAHGRKIARRQVIWLVDAGRGGQLYPRRYRKPKPIEQAQVIERLQAEGIPYTHDEWTLEFGQPFAHRAEAASFVRGHAPEAGDDEIADFLAHHLIPTGRTDFPLYLPNPKRVGAFFIEPAGKLP